MAEEALFILLVWGKGEGGRKNKLLLGGAREGERKTKKEKSEFRKMYAMCTYAVDSEKVPKFSCF